MIQIKTFTDKPHYSILVDIEERPVTLRFIWNDRGGFWSVLLADEFDDVVIDGPMKVIPVLEDDDFEAFDGIRQCMLFPGTLPGLLFFYGLESPSGSIEDLDKMQFLYIPFDELNLT